MSDTDVKRVHGRKQKINNSNICFTNKKDCW